MADTWFNKCKNSIYFLISRLVSLFLSGLFPCVRLLCQTILLYFSLFQAVFRKVNAEIGNPGVACATIEVEEHTDCKCGCDIEAASCTQLQVFFFFLPLGPIDYAEHVIQGFQEGYVVWNNQHNIHLVFWCLSGRELTTLGCESSALTTRPCLPQLQVFCLVWCAPFGYLYFFLHLLTLLHLVSDPSLV